MSENNDIKIVVDTNLDNFLLELAVTAKADYIITGDKDLLALNPFRKTQILTITKFKIANKF